MPFNYGTRSFDGFTALNINCNLPRNIDFSLIISLMRKLHNEELHNLYSSPNIIRQVRSRRLRWAGHVASMGEESVEGFGGKARRKETTWKAKT
jgi:hypothetical protein